MSEFIKIEIDMDRCSGIEKCGNCILVCPVNIFTENGDYPLKIKDNEDECTLCNLCLQGCKADAITIHKLYEE